MQTSCFSTYKGLDGIGIAGRSPVSYKGEEFKILAPKLWFFKKFKVDGDKDFYIKHYYKEVLDKLNPEEIYNLLKDNTLLCWEKSTFDENGKPNFFCHRRIVAEWIENKLGIEVPEYIEPKKDERKFNKLF